MLLKVWLAQGLAYVVKWHRYTSPHWGKLMRTVLCILLEGAGKYFLCLISLHEQLNTDGNLPGKFNTIYTGNFVHKGIHTVGHLLEVQLFRFCCTPLTSSSLQHLVQCLWCQVQPAVIWIHHFSGNRIIVQISASYSLLGTIFLEYKFWGWWVDWERTWCICITQSKCRTEVPKIPTGAAFWTLKKNKNKKLHPKNTSLTLDFWTFKEVLVCNSAVYSAVISHFIQLNNQPDVLNIESIIMERKHTGKAQADTRTFIFHLQFSKSLWREATRFLIFFPWQFQVVFLMERQLQQLHHLREHCKFQ